MMHARLHPVTLVTTVVLLASLVPAHAAGTSDELAWPSGGQAIRAGSPGP
jgi:hypothetical protein